MSALLIVVYSICGVYMLFNFKHDLHMLQQNSYRIKRYWNYLRNYDVNSLWRLSDLAMLFLVGSRLLEIGVAAVFTGVFCLTKIILIQRRKFKKPLVFTKRVWRLYGVASAIFIGLFLWNVFELGFRENTSIYYAGPILALIIFFCMSIFSWMFVVLAVVILMPVEKQINNGFITDAKKRLSTMKDLKIIGITGSYGKTSTKHFLERILSERFDVLITPGSYNTPMGVVRTIRELMKPYHKIFICEMGAKQKGDIKEICDIVHPEYGIITSVGPMHLETFKTIDNIRDTKFELIDSLPKSGLGIVNNDFAPCREKEIKNVDCVRYTTEDQNNPKADYKAVDIRYSSEGTSFDVITPENNNLSFQTKLLGETNVSDLLAAIITALRLGMSYEEIKRGVEAIEPVVHRLSMTTTPGGVTIIDDAFNSNPYGSKTALRVLSQFKTGKRIVVTPGMIELGDSQDELNMELGREIGKNCDIAIIVGEYNRKSIVNGIRATEFPEKDIIEASDFNEAQRILGEILSPGDVILYENDLPDTFK